MYVLAIVLGTARPYLKRLYFLDIMGISVVKRTETEPNWTMFSINLALHCYGKLNMPYGITQCYLPPGRGENPAFTPAEAGTRFSYPGGVQG